MPSANGVAPEPLATLSTSARMASFIFQLFPMLPSAPLRWLTKEPIIEQVTFPSVRGIAHGQMYRPAGSGPHRAVLICLGVVPFEVDHPQVPRLGNALARSGFAALLYWSPAMRDFRLDPTDIENIALAYEWLIGQPYVDPARSGLMGACVGGSFAFMAAASPRIRDQIAFVSAYAPFSSLRTFLADIASSTTSPDGQRVPWEVDQLTRKVFVHSLTEPLERAEAERLREAFDCGPSPCGLEGLSAEGRALQRLFGGPGIDQANEALDGLPASFQERIDLMSPLRYVGGIRTPLIVLLHDCGDGVIPVSESRQLHAKFGGRAGERYTELEFRHLDPAKLPVGRLVRQLWRFGRAMHPLFR